MKLLKDLLPFVILAIGALYFWVAQHRAPERLTVITTPGDVVLYAVFANTAEPRALGHYIEHLTWLPNIGQGSGPDGRHTNATTSAESIAYWISGKPEDLSILLDKLATVFRPLSVPTPMGLGERDILIREYELRGVGQPDVQISEEMDAFLFEGNPRGQSILGTPEMIRSLRLEDAKAFHDASHRPEAVRIVVTGNVSESKVLAAMKEVGFPDLAGPPPPPPAPIALGAPVTRIFSETEPRYAPRMIWRRVVTLAEPVDFDFLEQQCQLLRSTLDTNLPGGIAGPLRFESFIAKSFALDIAPLDERHVELRFVAEPDKGIGFNRLRDAFEATLAASASGIPAATYQRVRARRSGEIPDGTDPQAQTDWMARYVVNRALGLRPAKPPADLRGFDARLSRTAIETLLSALAGPGRTAIGFIGKDPSP